MNNRSQTGSRMAYPTLTTTNYIDWALGMRDKLQAEGLWEAIDPGVASIHKNKMAFAAILRAVPADMVSLIAVTDTAKEAWDAVRMRQMGDRHPHGPQQEEDCVSTRAYHDAPFGAAATRARRSTRDRLPHAPQPEEDCVSTRAYHDAAFGAAATRARRSARDRLGHGP